MPPRLWKPPQENKVEDSESDPEDDQRQKETIGAVARNVLRPNHSDGQDKRNRQQTNTRQPIQPLPRCEALIHCTPAPLSWHTGSPSSGRKTGGQSAFTVLPNRITPSGQESISDQPTYR